MQYVATSFHYICREINGKKLMKKKKGIKIWGEIVNTLCFADDIATSINEWDAAKCMQHESE